MKPVLVATGLFKTGTAPSLEGDQLLRLAEGFGTIQDKLVTMFNGTPSSAYGITAAWNADTSGGDTQVKIIKK